MDLDRQVLEQLPEPILAARLRLDEARRPLTLLTVCAATYQLMAGQPANAVFALVIGAISAFVAYSRRNPAPASTTRDQIVPVAAAS